MRQKFDVQLLELKRNIVGMSELVQRAIESSLQSLRQRDLEIAEKIIRQDELINNYESEIEQFCTNLIATQQPLASDLRKIVAAYKIISSLERMGDLAADIAKISIRIGPVPLIKPLIDLTKMVETVIRMMNIAIDSFINEDAEKARLLAEIDHEVDSYYKSIFSELFQMIGNDFSLASQGIYLLLITRYVERIGDYCTNIGEEVIYTELGIRENLNK